MSATTAVGRRALVMSSYRRLYRARSRLFPGDTVAMAKSRIEVRKQYLQHNNSPALDDEHFAALIGMVDEAEDMMRHSIVQGKLNKKTGHYEVKLQKDHVNSNTGERGEPPLVEPITQAKVEQIERQNEPVVVSTTKS